MKPIFYQVQDCVADFFAAHIGATIVQPKGQESAALTDMLLERFNITPKED